MIEVTSLAVALVSGGCGIAKLHSWSRCESLCSVAGQGNIESQKPAQVNTYHTWRPSFPSAPRGTHHTKRTIPSTLTLHISYPCQRNRELSPRNIYFTSW